MKNQIIILIFLSLSSFIKSQDTTKTITHEIGINAVPLIKQIISNNPAGGIAQLPYDFFYNIYFQDKVGIRLGAGINSLKAETSIDGQNTPRTTSRNTINLRGGVSYNFLKHNRLTLNVFGDGIYENIKFETVNTFTTFSFGGPSNTRTVTITSTDKIDGIGGQIGMGIKYNIVKHLSLYTEIPLVFLAENLDSDVLTEDSQAPSRNESSKSKNSTIRIILPVTVYLVLRF